VHVSPSNKEDESTTIRCYVRHAIIRRAAEEAEKIATSAFCTRSLVPPEGEQKTRCRTDEAVKIKKLNLTMK
jgi:hypothetical protein